MNDIKSSVMKFFGSVFGPTKSDNVVHIGIDIGGSHIGFGAVDGSGNLLSTLSCNVRGETLQETELLDIITNKSKSLLEKLPLDEYYSPYVLGGIGIACPGQCNDGILVAASNLPMLHDIALASSVSMRFGGVETVLLNDADAAIAAEVWGAASSKSFGISSKLKNARNVAMITIGTGIGMGLIIDGKLYQGSHGLIEGGHMILSIDTEKGRKCGCGQIGCAEAYASAKSTAARMAESDIQEGFHLKESVLVTSPAVKNKNKINKAQRTSITLDDFDITEDPAALCDTPPDEDEDEDVSDDADDNNDNNSSNNKNVVQDSAKKQISSKSELLTSSTCGGGSVGGSKHVFQRSVAGDKKAAGVLEVTAEVIALLCINICRVVDPEYIIIGGGMSQAGNPLLSAIEYHFMKRRWTVLPDDVKLVLAKGAVNAGIIGAALAAQKQAHLSSSVKKKSTEDPHSIIQSVTGSRVIGGLLLASAVTSSVVLLSAMRNASKSSFFLKLFVGPSRSLAITSSLLISVNMGIGSWLLWHTTTPTDQ